MRKSDLGLLFLAFVLAVTAVLSAGAGQAQAKPPVCGGWCTFSRDCGGGCRCDGSTCGDFRPTPAPTPSGVF